MPFAVTNEIKVITFQYKVIHNVLPTRATLYRDGIWESPICNLCKAEEQALHHLLINCTLTIDFWILFQDWWYKKSNETITLSTSHIFYGWHDRTKHWQSLNYCLPIAKFCLFCTSFRGDVLDFQTFLLLIHGKYLIRWIFSIWKFICNNGFRRCSADEIRTWRNVTQVRLVST